MESDEYEPYSFEACHYLLLNIVRDLSRASPSYEHGIEFIRNRMMDHFGVDGYDEAMAEVYKAIDDERWAWQVAGMDAMWSSWREHRQNLRIARARQGQINYIQNIPAVTGSSQGQFDYMQDGSRGQVDVTTRQQRVFAPDIIAPDPRLLGDWEDRVNAANNSKDRADLIASGPQLTSRQVHEVATALPQPKPQPKPENRAKRLVKKVSSIFASRQQQSSEAAGGAASSVPMSSDRPDVDGANDDPDHNDSGNMPTESSLSFLGMPSGAKAAVDLNRTLPPLPEETASRLALHTDAHSLNHSATGHTSIVSTTESSANHSVTSSKHNFRHITRDLLAPSTPEPQHAIINTLDPEKYSPANLDTNNRTMGKLNDRHVNITNGNSFEGERQTKWMDLYEKQEAAVKTSHQPIGMIHSHSEGSIAFRSKPGAIDTSRFNPVISKQNEAYAKFGEGVDSSLRSPTRGRTASRTPSPVKYLDDVPEDQMLDLTPSSTKRARSPIKKIFGENGWLGRSTSMKEMPTDQSRKIGLKNWGGKLKQRVEDLTDEFTKLIPTPFHHTGSPSKGLIISKFPVSLDPPTQAKLHSEIELMICATANQYLMTQRREGRMSVDSLVQVTKYWRSKNRPQVIEFQFDQQTQRDLVLYNLKSFRFYGPNAENPVSLNAMMLSWKTVAKEMSVRTFCTPDSVVRKHMHDCYKILEMLGAPLVTFLAFQEIQVRALATMREEQKRRDELEAVKYGVERRWEPPLKVRSSEEKEREAALFEG